MKYLFVLGRNPELSVAEIFSYLKRKENKIIDYQKDKFTLLVDVSEPLEGESIKNLGGTIAIGKILAQGESEELIKKLETQEIYYGTKNKMNYCVWNFSHDNSYNIISDYLKKRFRAEKLKATEKPLSARMQLQTGEEVKISKGNLDEEYFVFGKTFGKIIEKNDYKKIEERDMTKPQRRESLAISPRLAKIMINLSEIKESEILLDPFCGVGTILIEALLQGIKVIGIDLDKNAINGSIQNLGWKNFSTQNYKLIVGDSKKINVSQANAIVTEPDLGNILKKNLRPELAKKQINEFENLIIGVLNNLKNKASGKIVFTSPFIKTTKKKRISCDIDKIIQKTKLKKLKRFAEYRDNQTVGRIIFVLKN